MKVFLKDDHDEALKIWRKLGAKNLDLIHVDAHIDFVMHHARDPQEIFAQAMNLNQLKQNLEYTLSFLEYEKDLDKQTNIGNYIYPAMRDGLVKNFWWVIPGDSGSFEKNFKLIKRIFTRSFGGQKLKFIKKAKGLALVQTWGREFWVCVLDTLTVFTQPVLLDIDTDFLVVGDLSRADNICDIGKRTPWINPQTLKDKLALKVKNPAATTIVYSTNGGFTPMVYRHLGDELAYIFDPQKFASVFRRNAKAAESFKKFLIFGKKSDYQAAVKIEPAYRDEDNNYGPLYLAKNRFNSAQKELENILRVDPQNPAALKNMGMFFLQKREYFEALRYFQRVLEQKAIKKGLRSQIVFGIAQANFKLNRLDAARKWFALHKRFNPLSGQSYYCLAQIYRANKEYALAVENYRHALRLGFGGIDLLAKLLRVSFKLGIREKADIIDYVRGRLDSWKRNKKNAGQIWQIKKSLKKVKIS
jgi:tetratricopeptide (TPR) repeat protein